MSVYRCYLLNSGGHIVRTADLVDCPDELEARRAAISLLNSEPRYSGISVWQGNRRILAEFIPTGPGQSGVWPMDRAA